MKTNKNTRVKKFRDDRKLRWTDNEWGNRILIFLLVIAFPVGLYVMWTESNWKKPVKCLISAAWAMVLVLFVYVCFGTSMDYKTGGIVSAQLGNSEQMLAPLPPSNIPSSTHLLKSKDEASELISEPTATPVPTYVYCNDNGVYYHLKDCRYVYSTTPRVTLTQALNAGKTACPLCNPPKEETYDN